MTATTLNAPMPAEAPMPLIGLKRQARRAGLLYLATCITAPFAFIYVPGAIFVAGNATATAERIRESALMLRMSIASELFMCTMMPIAVLALYQLFKQVNQKLAITMAVLYVVAVPIQLVNVVNQIAAMILTSGAGFLSVFGKDQLDALAYLFMRLHSRGLEVAQVFWGVWLVPYGLVVMRSRFIPRILGAILIVAGAGYVLNSGASLLVPQYSHIVSQIATVLEFGEVPMLFWLLIWGARNVTSSAPAQSSTRYGELTRSSTGHLVLCLQSIPTIPEFT